MSFVQPVILSGRGVELVPLGLEHEAGLRAAAADGELWKLRVTSVPGFCRDKDVGSSNSTWVIGDQKARL